MKAIIAAVDFSRSADLVVSAAAALARALGGKVVLLTVVADLILAPGYVPPPKRFARIGPPNERSVRRRLTQLQRQLQSEFVPAEIVLRRGEAAPHIVAEATGRDAAFIVLGSHGHTALFDFVLGSTAQAVLRRSQRPVVVIPSRMSKPTPWRCRILSMPFAD